MSLSEVAATELADVDPYAALDAEAARIEKLYSGLSAEDAGRPSRCPGWSVRDVLAHLLATEEYHRACLDGRVKDVLAAAAAAGVTDLAGFNEAGVRAHDGESVADMLAAWRASNAGVRDGFRQRGDGTIDTSIGDYPARWQAVHVAGELACHADDAYAPVGDDEAAGRLAWRARYSRFTLAESKPEVSVEVIDGRTRVAGGGVDVEVDDDTLIEGVAGRLPADSPLTPAQRALLSATP